MNPEGRILIIGHRGCPSLAPENTLAGLQLAASQGADMIEFDIQASAEGEPVVIHDATLDRTTNGSGPVAVAPLATILRLDAGSWHSAAFAGQRVPTLEQVLTAPGIDLPMIAEIKEETAASPAWKTVAARITGLIRTHSAGRRIAVSSFSPRILSELRLLAPEIPRGILVPDTATPAEVRRLVREIEPYAVHVPADLLAPGLLAVCEDFSLPLYAYTVNDPEEALRLARLGAAGIFTDRPDLLARTLRRP